MAYRSKYLERTKARQELRDKRRKENPVVLPEDDTEKFLGIDGRTGEAIDTIAYHKALRAAKRRLLASVTTAAMSTCGGLSTWIK